MFPLSLACKLGLHPVTLACLAVIFPVVFRNRYTYLLDQRTSRKALPCNRLLQYASYRYLGPKGLNPLSLAWKVGSHLSTLAGLSNITSNLPK